MVSRETVWYDLDQTISPEKFSFDREEYTVEVGDNIRIRHNADPYVSSLLNWSVDDPSVCARVSNGVFEGLKPGTVTITAVSEDGVYSDTCTVTVVEAVIPPSAISTLKGTRSSNAGKLINGENFVGVGTSLDMRMFQLKHRIILACTEEQAQYIQCNDNMYRALWMVPVNNDKISYETLDVIMIEKEEYDILYAAIESGKDVVIEPEETPEIEDEVIVDPN